MCAEDGRMWMSFNGEIYNAPELRTFCEAKGHRFTSSMDGEVILHLWEMEGAAALARLNGIFAVAVADARTGEVVLARDPVGVKPLFYSLDRDNQLRFASEVAALRHAGADPGGEDLVALAQFLSFLWIPDPRTPWAGIRGLLPGQALRWTASGTELFEYGEPLVGSPEPTPTTAAGAVASATERVAAAGRRQLLADVPIGLMASGGVDSGLLWWAVHESLARAYTITWAEDGTEKLGDDERAVAELAVRYATPVRRLEGETATSALPPSGDLFADPAYDLTRLIAGTARDDGMKVLLSGQGGDELLAGYRRHWVATVLKRIRLGAVGRAVLGGAVNRGLGRVPSTRQVAEYGARLLRAASERDPFRGYMQLCTYSTPAERAAALGCTEREVANDVVWQRHLELYESLPPDLGFLRKVMAVDLGVYLPGLGLAYVDRAGMEFGVEIRVPWLDLELLRWTLALPDDVLVRRGRGKWLGREVAAKQLSPALANRPKRGFAAPAHRVGDGGSHGERGFRQGAYFSRAVQLLRAHRDGGSA
jgi:asparagine synthase (glutamine-hydrolysing)